MEERRGDLLVPSTLHGIADGCQAVVHAAAERDFAAHDPARQRRLNVGGTQAMLGEAQRAGVARFALIGCLGTIQETGGDDVVEESTPPAMRYESAYVRQMFEAEAAVLDGNGPEGFRSLVVSSGAMVGAGCDSILTNLSRLYLRRELPFRCLEDAWLAVTGTADVAACVLAALEHGAGGRRYFAIGESVRLGEFYRRLEARSGVPPPRRRIPDLLAEELGEIAPLLPSRSFLKRLVLPRELVLHMRRLAPARNGRTRRELGFVPERLASIVEELVRGAAALPREGGPGSPR